MPSTAPTCSRAGCRLRQEAFRFHDRIAVHAGDEVERLSTATSAAARHVAMKHVAHELVALAPGSRPSTGALPDTSETDHRVEGGGLAGAVRTINRGSAFFDTQIDAVQRDRRTKPCAGTASIHGIGFSAPPCRIRARRPCGGSVEQLLRRHAEAPDGRLDARPLLGEESPRSPSSADRALRR